MTRKGLIARNVTVTSSDGHTIVNGAELQAQPGRVLVIVGESGAGKSMLARAMSGLLPPGLQATGTVKLSGQSVDLSMGDAEISRLRGDSIVWLPQDPYTSLSPTHTCGEQILAKAKGSKHALGLRLAELLEDVGLPERVAKSRPHHLSGGMRQRVAIAAAIDVSPDVLIADEPTTALDVTTQRGVLDLLTTLTRERSMALVLITHDLAVAREYGDDVIVMRHGNIVEAGPVNVVLAHPVADYTRSLAELEPRLDGPNPRARVTKELQATDEGAGDGATTKRWEEALVHVETVRKVFPATPGSLPHMALWDVSLTIHPGEAVALVGESGSGKTTLARCIVGLEKPTSGTITMNTTAEERRTPKGWRVPRVSLVFQNPYSALNPALSIEAALVEALSAVGGSKDQVAGLLESVGLSAEFAHRLPRELSGGERQRVAIARAIATRPQLLVCDEPVSALDVSVQAQVLELLENLRQQMGFALLFITHDLAVARQASDRMIVMKEGEIVEQGYTEDLLTRPQHPYTRELLKAVPGLSGLGDVPAEDQSQASGDEIPTDLGEDSDNGE